MSTAIRFSFDTISLSNMAEKKAKIMMAITRRDTFFMPDVMSLMMIINQLHLLRLGSSFYFLLENCYHAQERQLSYN